MATEDEFASLDAMIEHEESLEKATNHFHYQDVSVILHVGDQVFSVRNTSQMLVHV